jgi:hypothetical protein
MKVTLALLVKIPSNGIASFSAYENLVLPILHKHGGTIERRLRTQDHMTELHILSFLSQAAFDGYLADPQREKHRHLLVQSNATTELFNMEDVS